MKLGKCGMKVVKCGIYMIGVIISVLMNFEK